MIHEAAAPIYTQIELREGEARVLGSTPVAADSFMLFVSTLEPRKNVPTLLQALRICLDRRPDCPYRLVVAGSRGWRDTAIFDAARDLKLGDHVLFVGSVGQYDLRWLYNACRLYINPRSTKALACRCSRPWPAARPAWPRPHPACPRSAATRAVMFRRSTPGCGPMRSRRCGTTRTAARELGRAGPCAGAALLLGARRPRDAEGLPVCDLRHRHAAGARRSRTAAAASDRSRAARRRCGAHMPALRRGGAAQPASSTASWPRSSMPRAMARRWRGPGSARAVARSSWWSSKTRALVEQAASTPAEPTEAASDGDAAPIEPAEPPAAAEDDRPGSPRRGRVEQAAPSLAAVIAATILTPRGSSRPSQRR